MLGGPAELSLGSSLRLHWSGASLSLSLSSKIASWAVLKRCVLFVFSATHVSFCFVVVFAELRALLLQRRWLFEGNFAGLGGHAGACACPSKGTDPSCLICCLCFALA